MSKTEKISSYQIDPTDEKILRILKDNADLTNKEIAAQLSMSVTPVYERIKKLKKSGAIKSIKAEIDPKALNKNLIAFCNVSLKEHAKAYLEKFEIEINQIEEIEACYHIAGHFDYLLLVLVKDMNAYHIFITQKLSAIHNIGTVESSFVMNVL